MNQSQLQVANAWMIVSLLVNPPLFGAGPVSHDDNEETAPVQFAQGSLSPPATIAFELGTRKRALGPDFGPFKKHCRIFVNEDLIATEIRFTYEEAPKYFTLGRGGTDTVDFDMQGNLILWRPVTQYAWKTAAVNVLFSEQEMLLIDQDGTVLESAIHKKYFRYPINSQDSLSELYHFLLCFDGHLKTLITREKNGNEDVGDTLTAEGKWRDNSKGIWSISRDPSARDIIRKAIFTRIGDDDPTVHVQTDGIFNSGNHRLAKFANISYSLGKTQKQVMDIVVHSYEPIVSPESLARIRNIFTPPFDAKADLLDLSGSQPRRLAKSTNMLVP